MLPNGKHRTTCRSCPQPPAPGSWVIDHYTLGIPIIGQSAPERVIKFVGSLTEHVAGHHKDDMQKISASLQDFYGLLLINQFDVSDPGLLQRADGIRAEIHRRTRRHFITDEQIAVLTGRLTMKPADKETVGALMRGMRDAYEEIGEYSPEKQADQILLTP